MALGPGLRHGDDRNPVLTPNGQTGLSAIQTCDGGPGRRVRRRVPPDAASTDASVCGPR